ncbi:unnamed protein product [Pylaiella littoralis]
MISYHGMLCSFEVQHFSSFFFPSIFSFLQQQSSPFFLFSPVLHLFMLLGGRRWKSCIFLLVGRLFLLPVLVLEPVLIVLVVVVIFSRRLFNKIVPSSSLILRSVSFLS